eukprot:129945-Rhodomonas_salina.1
MSATSIRCLTPTGIGQTERISMTAGCRSSSMTETVSFDAVAVSSILPGNMPASGMLRVSIYGQGLGYFGSS